MPQSPENGKPGLGDRPTGSLTPRQKMLQHWIWSTQLRKTDPMQKKKKKRYSGDDSIYDPEARNLRRGPRKRLY